MSFTGRTLPAIRAAILSDWATRMTASGYVLDQSVGSWAYNLSDSLASELLAEEGSAEALRAEIVPSTTDTATLDRMTAIQGQARQEGETWQGTVTVTGVDGVYDITGRTLIYNGFVYNPSATSVTVSTGTATLALVAALSGTASNRAVADVMTWHAPPTGLAPTLSVASSTVEGTAAETDADLAQRVEFYRAARPAGGNPSHLVELAEAHERVTVAYCYPVLAPNAGAYSDANLDTLGAFVLVVAGPAQGTGATNTRQLSAPNLAHVRAYFDGTEDASEATIVGSRLFSAQIDPTDVGIENAVYSTPGTIDISVTNGPDYPPPWTGSMTIDAGASSVSSLVVVGDQTAKDGKAVAIQTSGTGTPVRGRVEKRTLGTGGYNGGTNRTTWTLSPVLAASPSGFVDPAPANWLLLLTAIYSFFDSLGPGDVPDAATVVPPAGLTRRRRFPPEAWSGKSSVAPADLIRAAMSATGTVDCSTNSPTVLTTIGPKGWFYLDLLRIRFP